MTKQYQRLHGQEHQEQQQQYRNGAMEHELQDLSPAGDGESDNLLSSFSNDESSRVTGVRAAPEQVLADDSRVIAENLYDTNDNTTTVTTGTTITTSSPSAVAANSATSTLASSTLAPSTSITSQQIANNINSAPPGRRRQVPNTIIHKLINDPRISKYLPHLVRNYYQPVYSGAPMGQGLNNDGVFTNMAAKPSTRDETSESLPSYEQLAMDSTPPYWESSVISPGFEDEVFVDGLPVGSIMIFIWNFIVSFSFQFIGFFLTYLLHTSHGSKEGSRAGLGLTFMSYGYGLLPVNYYNKGDSPIDKFEPKDPNSIDVDNMKNIEGQFYKNPAASTMAEDASRIEDSSDTPILSFALIALGLFIVLKSIIDYHRARQMENPNYGSTNETSNVTTSTTSQLQPQHEEV